MYAVNLRGQEGALASLELEFQVVLKTKPSHAPCSSLYQKSGVTLVTPHKVAQWSRSPLFCMVLAISA